MIYVFTHDSIFVGEDGPTHEPMEHLAALRVIPNLQVLRPADADETAVAWGMALGRTDGPTVLALSRAGPPGVRNTMRGGGRRSSGEPTWRWTAARGTRDGDRGYGGRKSAWRCGGRPARRPEGPGRRSRGAVRCAGPGVPGSARPARARRVVIEGAGTSFGWTSPFDDSTLAVTIDRFGELGPWQKLAERFGITAAALAEKIRNR